MFYVYVNELAPDDIHKRMQKPILAYQRIAEIVAEKLGEYLNRHPASPAAIDWRASLPPTRIDSIGSAWE
jgi:hypothetical protein